MMQTFDQVRFDAFTQLLAQRDPRDLPRRAHVYRCEGDPNRRATRFPEIFMGWLQRRHLATDLPDPMVFATRNAKPGMRRGRADLRLLRATA